MITNPDTICNSSLTREVVIASNIADLQGPTAEYYAIRYFDSKQHRGLNAGSGWSRCSLSELATILDKKPATIRKNLYQGLHSGFFWNVHIKGDAVLLRYKSEARIAKDKGLYSLGAIALVELNQLKHIRILATDAHTEALQRKSIYLANQAVENGEQKRWFTKPSKLFLTKDQKQSQNWGAETNVIYQGKRCTFVNSEFVRYGASQKGVGQSMTRHTQTIRRRLSHSYRSRKGLSISKTQLAYRVNQPVQNWQEAADLAILERDYTEFKECQRRFNFGRAVFNMACNVYQFDIHILRQRWKRRTLKKLWDAQIIPSQGASACCPKSTKSKIVTEGCKPRTKPVTQLKRYPLWRKVGNRIEAVAYSHLTCLERKLAQIPY